MEQQHDAWDDEWDRMGHTNYEYRMEIRQLRQRCAEYWSEIERLRDENDQLRMYVRQEIHQ